MNDKLSKKTDYGYFDSSVDALTSCWIKKYDQLFSLWLGICGAVGKARLHMSCPKSIDGKQVETKYAAAILLFERCVQHNSAAANCSLKGMQLSSSALLRCSLEHLYYLGALANSEEVVGRLMLNYSNDVKNLALFLVRGGYRKNTNGDDLGRIIANLKGEIRKASEINNNILRKDEAAEIAELTETLKAYKAHSKNIHFDVNWAQNEGLNYNSDGVIESFLYGPSDLDLVNNLYDSCNYLILSITYTGKIFQYSDQLNDEVKGLRAKLASLADLYDINLSINTADPEGL